MNKKILTMRNGLILIGMVLFTDSVYAACEGFYLGAMLGQTNTNNLPMNVYNCKTGEPCDAPPQPDGYGVQENVSPDNTGLGGRIYLGINIGKYAGVEFGYTHFANTEYNADQLDKDPQIQENGVDLMVKAQYPIESFGIFGRLGLAYVRSTEGGSLQPPPDSTTEKNHSINNHVGPAAGIGVFYDFTPNWEVDISANRYFKGGGGFQNADLFAIGFSYHLVTLYCGQFIC